jgi:hypothetical protein
MTLISKEGFFVKMHSRPLNLCFGVIHVSKLSKCIFISPNLFKVSFGSINSQSA